MFAQKQQLIVEAIRGEIVSGALVRGRRMPSHAEIAQRFGVSRVTAQWALRHLSQEGFIHTRPRSGTFVAEQPPHLSGYALVFWNNPNDSEVWSRFYTALTDAARVLEREQGRHFRIFYNINRHADSDDYRVLHSLVATHRLAGIIFADLHPDTWELPLITEPGVPRVALQQMAPPGLTRIYLDLDSWMRKALDHFRSRGCKRLALLTNNPQRESRMAFDRLAAARGMVCPPHWQQSISSNLVSAADHCVRLLMQGAPRSRPDALLITDDHFIEDASAGLIAEGIRVPQDLEVVAHANYPLAARSVLPMRRIGFNMRTVLQTAVDRIDRLRAGETPADLTAIPAEWEDEVPRSVAVASEAARN